MPNKISVVISAFNEEKKVEKTLKSVSWADEIVFVDNSSTDNTPKIAEKYTKKIIRQKNDPQKIDIQKNKGIENAEGDFILVVDADELVTEELKNEILELLNKDDSLNGYYIPRKNIIFGKQIEYTGWYPDYQLRLFRNGKGSYKTEHVHEGIKVEGETKYLKEHLLHSNYETISQFINKNMISYAENESDNLINSGLNLKPSDLISIPAKEFMSRFFSRKGYKDGIHGLFLSLLMASSHLITLGYVWEKQGFKKVEEERVMKETEVELIKTFKEIRYWINHSKIEQAKNLPTKYFLKFKNKI
jgi:glycosyltransferase involved in cell wall biosynthesis